MQFFDTNIHSDRHSNFFSDANSITPTCVFQVVNTCPVLKCIVINITLNNEVTPRFRFDNMQILKSLENRGISIKEIVTYVCTSDK